MLRPLRSARVLGPGSIIAGIVCIQVSAAIAAPLLGRVGVVSVVGGRFLVGALVLLVAVRPRIRGHSRSEWGSIAVYGSTMVVMTCSFYGAVHRLPLGTAATLLYLGPFVVALAYIRRAWEALLPVVALVGVYLVAGPSDSVDATGVALGLLAALALGLYTVFAQRVGLSVAGFDGLALSVTIAALLLSPLTIVGATRVDASDVAAIVAVGVVGVAIGFACDFWGIRLSSARVAATLYSLEPAIAAAIGAVVLGQHLPPRAIAGMALVVAAGIVASTTINPPHKPVGEAI